MNCLKGLHEIEPNYCPFLPTVRHVYGIKWICLPRHLSLLIAHVKFTQVQHNLQTVIKHGHMIQYTPTLLISEKEDGKNNSGESSLYILTQYQIIHKG